MSNAVKHDFRIAQGASFSRTITYETDADPRVPIDLTGYTASMTVRKRANTDAAIELTTENGRIALGGTAGTITLTISAADTAATRPIDGVYDLKVVSPTGIEDFLLEGSMRITRSITR